MLVELNKVYLLTAPKATQGMFSKEGENTVAKMTDGVFVNFNKIINDKEVYCYAKGFTYKGIWMQAVIFREEHYPESVVLQRLEDAVKKHKEFEKNPPQANATGKTESLRS